MLAVRSKKKILIVAILLVGLLIFLSINPRIKSIHGKTMGTSYNILYVANFFTYFESSVNKKVEILLEKINDQMSTYRQDSELMRLNRSALNTPIKVSKPVFKLVQSSIEFSKMSEGIYDVTVGPLVNLWGFGPNLSKEKIKKNHFENSKLVNNKPSEAEINTALNRVGYSYLQLDADNLTITKTRDVFIDLSSIAKGYGVDQLGDLLVENGLNDFMIEVGGEILTRGYKPGHQAWKVGIRGPKINEWSKPDLILDIYNKAIATSGDYLNFYDVNSHRYSHIINPITGYPEEQMTAEVSVIADTVANADALATMFMLMGYEKGLLLANKRGIAVHFTYHTGKEFKSVSSDAFVYYKK